MGRRVLFAAAVVFAASIALASSARAADDDADVSGTWEVTIDIAGQQGTPTFELKQEGEKITGTYKGQFGEKEVTGEIDDGEIELKFEIQDGAIATYTGTVDKDSMKGHANYADQATGEWTAKRKKAK